MYIEIFAMDRSSTNLEEDPQLNDASEEEVKLEVEVEGWDINPIFFFALLLCILTIQNVFSLIFSPRGIATLVFVFGIYKVIRTLISKSK